MLPAAGAASVEGVATLVMCLQGHLTEVSKCKKQVGSIRPKSGCSHIDLLSRAQELGSRSNVVKGVVDLTACRGNSMECNGTGNVKELAIGDLRDTQ